MDNVSDNEKYDSVLAEMQIGSTSRRMAYLRRWMRAASREDLIGLISRDRHAIKKISSVARVLRETVESFDAANGSVSVRFEPRLRLANAWKHLHGGFVAAALDEAAALAASLYVGPRNFGATLSNTVTYMRPVQLVAFRVDARVLERSLNFLTVQCSLYEDESRRCAYSLSIVSLRGASLQGQGIAGDAGDRHGSYPLHTP